MFFKNILFTVITVGLFFAGLELVLALSGVRPVLLSEDPLVGFADNVPLFVEATGEDGSGILRTADQQIRWFNYQEFPQHKGRNSYRIFCLGGSTTYGRPYSDGASFCGWLRAYLEAADPTRHWEVINAGGISFASYRVARLMNELAGYQPDLFIVYSGHNEFLEERSYGGLIDLPGWVISLNAALSGTRTYSAMKKLIDAVQPGEAATAQQGNTLSGDVDEILNHSVGPDRYHRDDTLKQQIITHYRLNMIRMVRIARSAGADIVFVQPAKNLKDMSPFKSEHKAGLDAQANHEWQALYERARQLHDAGNASAALAVYRQALSIDDRYAELHYRIGQVLFDLGQYPAAETAFRRAVEEDIVPLRILDSMQQIVAEVAAAEDVPLIDFPGLLRDAYLTRYEHAIPGAEYFPDHVHTSIEGYRMLGLALFDQMVARGVANPDASWSAARVEAVSQELIAGLDPTYEGRALLTMGRVMDWAGKHDEAYVLFQRSLEILGPSPMLFDRLARSAFIRGEIDQSIHYLRETLRHYPGIPEVNSRLGMLLEKQGDIDAAIEHCRAELELNPTDHYTHAGLANLLEKQGDDAAALQHYTIALELKPDYEYVLVKLAYLLIRQERYDEALIRAQEALRINPEQYRAHSALGLIMKHRGELEQAAEQFAQALRLQPRDEVARENLQVLPAAVHRTGVVTDLAEQAGGLTKPEN
jgi:tetratricopeptide (TPR) repeat protein